MNRALLVRALLWILGSALMASPLAAADGGSKSPTLYVGLFKAITVDVFQGAENNQPAENLYDGLGTITGDIVVDQEGNVYVTTTPGWVVGFPGGGLVPGFRYQFKDQSQPPLTFGLAVDSDGTLYAALNNDAEVVEYAQGKPDKALFSIPMPSGQTAFAVAVDGQKNLYIEYGAPNQPGYIEKCPPHSTECTNLNLTLGGASPHLALDSNGRLIACDAAAGQIDIFPSGGGKPRVISQGLSGCPFFALNKSETQLFVANQGSESNQGVSVFDYETGKLVNTISDGIPSNDIIYGVALSPAAQ
jgi:DNA-binding beta-propeller fold protein YncE